MLHKGAIDMDFIIIFLFYTPLSIIWQNLTFIFWLLTASLSKLVAEVGFFFFKCEWSHGDLNFFAYNIH